MSHKKKFEFYFYRPEGYVEKEMDGVKVYRDATLPGGMWRPLPPACDRLLEHIQLYTNRSSRQRMLDELTINHSCVSRMRKEPNHIPLEWLVKMADFSGLSLEELRTIGGLKPSVRRYK